MTEYRVEKDSMGELKVPKDALYAAQTQRAVDNFPISGLTMPRQFIRALGLIKGAAARVNADLELLDGDTAAAIGQATAEVERGDHDAHFPIDVFQTGSGTSSNMNANEVIATLARSRVATIHPNDHVNMCQSSNDVIPTAIHLSACLLASERLLPALEHLAQVTEKKATALADEPKTGRTHLMDAMPVTFGQELGCWARQVRSGIERVTSALERLARLPQGGTAVGTGINAHPEFAERIAARLSEATGFEFRRNDNLFESISSMDAAAELSGQLKTVACSLMKIANDLRWMNSGPLAGIGEIALPALQPGSSIMPGKVNPVVPEAVCMVCAQVIGNDAAVTVGAQSGNFQLNVMLPMIAYNLIQSLEILASAARLLADSAIEGFSVNAERIQAALERNPILVTALNPVIGYELGAATAKRAYAEGRPIKEVARETTELSDEQLERLLDPRAMTRGGIHES